MQEVAETAVIPVLRNILKRLHNPLEVMLLCARWYAANPLSFLHPQEIMQERGVFVDHSIVDRSLGAENSASHGAPLSAPQGPVWYNRARCGSVVQWKSAAFGII
jgi:hypothetical protein